MPHPEIFHPDQYGQFANLAEAFFFNADTVPDIPAYDQATIDPAGDGSPRPYVTVLHRESKDRVLKLAAHLESLGVQPGDSVAMLAFDRPEWAEAEMAIYTVGGRMVGAYVRDPLDRLHHILRDSGARYVFVENQEQLEKVLRLAGLGPALPASENDQSARLPLLKLDGIVTFEHVEIPPQCQVQHPPIHCFQEIVARTAVRAPRSFAGLTSARNDLASIFYTSASTGLPKGVPVTHGQTLENLRQIAASGLVDYERFTGPDADGTQPVVTSLLPERAHVYAARVMQMVATSPALARYPAVVDRQRSQITPEFRESMRRDLFEGGAQIVIVVPKILIAAEKRIRQRLTSGGLKERLAGLVLNSAAQRILAEGRKGSRLGADLAYRAFAPLRNRILRRVRERVVGLRFEFFVSGGAKLPSHTAAFFWALGIKVYEGYGSTETNCPIAVGTALAHRLGTAGKVFAGVEVKIDPDTREVLVRGPNVAQGYWQLPEQTAQTWSPGGWYHTRDIGRLDDDGFLHIHDRLDNILVLQNGEKVSAAEIEGRFAAIPYVDTAIVIGQQRPGLVALVTLNEQAIEQWSEVRGPFAGENTKNALVRALVWSEIEEKVNGRAMRGFERISNMAIIEALHPDERTLTATEKVPRHAIEQKYDEVIERLYAECGVGLDGEIAVQPRFQQAAAV